jgi:hypothetical protein
MQLQSQTFLTTITGVNRCCSTVARIVRLSSVHAARQYWSGEFKLTRAQ